jgi:hypothetical protein
VTGVVGCYKGLGLVLGWALCCAGFAACGGQRAKSDRAPASLEPKACRVDEVREYHCESLLPWTNALPAPEPYSSCPSGIEVKDAVFPPRSRAGRFDSQRTAWVRKRSPQQCCYSWCGKLAVVEASEVVNHCRQPLAFPESACVPELEVGTRLDLAAEPFDRCALAIRPPRANVFSVPKNGALFSPSLTAAKRRGGDSLCCYGWCSIAPPGTGLERMR